MKIIIDVKENFGSDNVPNVIHVIIEISIIRITVSLEILSLFSANIFCLINIKSNCPLHRQWNWLRFYPDALLGKDHGGLGGEGVKTPKKDYVIKEQPLIVP